MASVFAQHLHGSPPWEQLPALPTPLRELLARMLQKKPADRPQTPSDLMREISRCRAALKAGNPFVRREWVLMPFDVARDWLAQHQVAAAAVLTACLLPLFAVTAVMRPEPAQNVAAKRAPDPVQENAEPVPPAEGPAFITAAVPSPSAPTLISTEGRGNLPPTSEPSSAPQTAANANPPGQIDSAPSEAAPTKAETAVPLLRTSPSALPRRAIAKVALAPVVPDVPVTSGMKPHPSFPSPAQRPASTPPGITVGYISSAALAKANAAGSDVVLASEPAGDRVIPIVTQDGAQPRGSTAPRSAVSRPGKKASKKSSSKRKHFSRIRVPGVIGMARSLIFGR